MNGNSGVFRISLRTNIHCHYYYKDVCKTLVVILYCPQTAKRRAEEQDRQRAEKGLVTPAPYSPLKPDTKAVVVRP